MRSRILWSVVGALVVTGLLWEVNQFLIFRALFAPDRDLDLADQIHRIQNQWTVAELAASAIAGGLIAIHAGGRRHVEAALASLLGIALVLGLMRIDDGGFARSLVDGRFLAMIPLYALAGAGTALLVARLAPTAQAGRVLTFAFAGSALVGIAMSSGFVASELHVPDALIFLLLIVVTAGSAYVVQTLVPTRRVGAIAAAPLFYALCALIAGQPINMLAILILSTVYPAASWLGARSAWKRKPANPASPLPLARARAR